MSCGLDEPLDLYFGNKYLGILCCCWWPIQKPDHKSSNVLLFRIHLNYHCNFESFGSAMLALVRVSTCDTFASLLADLAVQPPLCDQQAGNCGQPMAVVSLFFVAFILLVCTLLSGTSLL